MHVSTISSASLQRLYNIKCQAMDDFLPKLPFRVVWCEVETRGHTTAHRHQAIEAFYILSGTGLMRINDKQAMVRAGNLIHIPSQSLHQISNPSSKDKLLFLSIYSTQNPPSVQARQIFSPPPTPNGELHLGHVSGPYLSADALRRFFSMQKQAVCHLSGSDDFQPYILLKAKNQSQDPYQMARHYRNKIARGFSLAEIKIDTFYHPLDDDSYQQLVRDFFQKLVQRGLIYQRQSQTLFCQSCQRFMDEASVIGTCLACQSLSGGGTCESCAAHAALIGGLKHARCSQCESSQLIEKKQQQWFFSIFEYAKPLRSFLKTTPMADNTRQYALNFLKKIKTDFAITRPGDWGIPLDPNHPCQRFDTWFEMAANYFQRSQGHPENIYTFGIDNSFYYTLLIPALFIAMKQTPLLPIALISNDFYLLDRQKFSTSRDHALWAIESFEEYDLDVLRLYLAKTRSESTQQSFSATHFEQFIQQHIDDGLYHWVARVNQKIAAPCTPSVDVSTKQGIENDLLGIAYQVECSYSINHFSLNQAAKLLCEYIARANMRVLQDFDLESELALIRLFAILAHPIMPCYSEQLLKALHEDIKWDTQLKINIPYEGGLLPHLSARRS